MTDPLKNKFKWFTLKWYHPKLRHDLQYINSSLEEDFLNDPSITLIEWYYDHDDHVGIHINGVLKSTSYKNLYSKYSHKDTKIQGLYLKMGDLPSFKDYNSWLFYCYMRKETNWKRFHPIERDPDDEPPLQITF